MTTLRGFAVHTIHWQCDPEVLMAFLPIQEAHIRNWLPVILVCLIIISLAMSHVTLRIIPLTFARLPSIDHQLPTLCSGASHPLILVGLCSLLDDFNRSICTKVWLDYYLGKHGSSMATVAYAVNQALLSWQQMADVDLFWVLAQAKGDDIDALPQWTRAQRLHAMLWQLRRSRQSQTSPSAPTPAAHRQISTRPPA